MPAPLKRLPVVFYETAAGAEPVRDWLDALSPEDRRAVGFDLAKVEFGWPVGMPLCRNLGQGLWEVRISLPRGRIARVLFCIDGREMVLLHGFEKKSQKTPLVDLAIARKRMKEVLA